MRAGVCILASVVMLLVGFLATPSVFQLVNPGYLMARNQYGAPLNKLAQELADIDSKIADARARITKLEINLKDLASQSAAKMAAMDIAKAKPEDIALAGIENGAKANGLANARSEVVAEREALEEKRRAIEATSSEMNRKVAATETDSNNIYLVARALALGAIGALMSIFAKYLATPSTLPLFGDNSSLSRMWTSIAMGGIVAVVVVGLFLTGFISIFSNAAQNSAGAAIDYWKVTILCLLAGAFSDRLFQAAAKRMDAYLGTIEGEPKTVLKPAEISSAEGHTESTRGSATK